MEQQYSALGSNRKEAGVVGNTEREWMSYREATELTGLSRGTIWKLIGGGRITAAKVGRAVRINRRSLEQYLRDQNYADSIRS